MNTKEPHEKLKYSALKYRKEFGFSVIPVNPKTKKPLLDSWKPYQDEKSSVEKISNWWNGWKNAAIGIVTGPISNLLVLDVDRQKGWEYVTETKRIGSEPTSVARTGGGGWHIYYTYPKDKSITIGARIGNENLGLDFRGKGGYVIAPPSGHPSGNCYKWDKAIDNYSPILPPDWLLNELQANGNKSADVDDLLGGVKEGKRNNSATKVIGRYLSKFDENNWDLAWDAVKSWNQRNNPPLPEDELRKTFKSIAKREKSKSSPPTKKIQQQGEESNAWDKVNKLYQEGDNKGARFHASEILLGEREFAALPEGDQLLVYQDGNGTFTDYGKECIETVLQREIRGELTSHEVSEIIDHIRRSSLQQESTFGPDDPNLICLKNGVFNLKREKLLDHDPKYQFRNSIPVSYNPHAQSEKLTDFLETTFRANDIPLIEEIAGYCLYRDYFIQKAFMFIGSGSNGKGVTLDLLTNMLGQDNVSGKSLQGLTDSGNRFAANSLYRKYANIAGDLPGGKLEDTGMFKQLTGQDLIEADVKYSKRPIKFQNYATMLFSANKVPQSPDDTDAFHRRWIIITFPYMFTNNPEGKYEKPKDPNLRKKLDSKKVKSALFNRAVQGLQRLLKNGQFSYDPSTSEARREWERKARPIKAFVQDKLEVDEDKREFKSKVYEAYKEYCREHGVPENEIKKQAQFSKELKKYVKWESSRPKNPDTGKRESAYEGFELIEIPF